MVDRLLESPHYGERWGRYWLDLARYADGKLGASRDTPYENAFRYRDWVIGAFNRDLPYNRMIEAQIAADRLDVPDKDQLLAGLGFQALGVDADERLDVTTRTFLGLTVGCAQCHDHKYDPIPTKDYYSLYGVFASTSGNEVPLVGASEVEAYKNAKKAIDDLEKKIDDFISKRSVELQEILAQDTSRYLMAAWSKLSGAEFSMAGLDSEILDRWIAYLKSPAKDHPYLKPWDEMVKRGTASVSREEVQRFADSFGALTLAMFVEKNEIDDRNYVKLGGAKGVKDERTRQYTNLESLEIEKYYLWRDLGLRSLPAQRSLLPGRCLLLRRDQRNAARFRNTRRRRTARQGHRSVPERSLESSPGPYACRTPGVEEGVAAAVSVSARGKGLRQARQRARAHSWRRKKSRGRGAATIPFGLVRRRAGTVHQGQWPAGAGRSDREASAGGPRHGEPCLAVALRTRNRAQPE